MSKKIFKLVHDQARRGACEFIANAPNGYIVTIEEPRRSLDANAAMWPILEAFARQLQWPINGVMTTITAEDWKDILTCAFRNEVPRVAAGLNGGMVLLGQRTSKFKKKEFSEWMEFLWSVATDKGVTVYEREAA